MINASAGERERSTAVARREESVSGWRRPVACVTDAPIRERNRKGTAVLSGTSQHVNVPLVVVVVVVYSNTTAHGIACFFFVRGGGEVRL